MIDLPERWELCGGCRLRKGVYFSPDESWSFLMISKLRKVGEVHVLPYISSLVLSEVKVYRMEDQGAQSLRRVRV